MNVKKIIIEKLLAKLDEERRLIVRKINDNKYEFKKLEREQTSLKRQLPAIDEMIKGLRLQGGDR